MNENRQPSTRGMRARGPKRPLLALLIIFLAALPLASCGGAGEGSGAAPAGDGAAEPEAPATETSAAEETRAGEEQARVDRGHPALGEESAPVVMVEYADYK